MGVGRLGVTVGRRELRRGGRECWESARDLAVALGNGEVTVTIIGHAHSHGHVRHALARVGVLARTVPWCGFGLGVRDLGVTV